MKNIFVFLVLFLFLFSLASAGVGIKMTEGSIKLQENEGRCVTVGAYNPFETGTNVVISVSPELAEVLTEQEAETKYLPPGTSSDNAIPLKFCFKVSQVYERSYLAGKVIDKLDCTEPMKEYRGEVIIESVSSGVAGGGAGGSATKMSVSQPFIVRVACSPYGWDLSLVYIISAVLSAVVVGFVLFRRYRKPKSERLKEKMANLKEEMKKAGK